MFVVSLHTGRFYEFIEIQIALDKRTIFSLIFEDNISIAYPGMFVLSMQRKKMSSILVHVIPE